MRMSATTVAGSWRITSMETWDANYFDMEAPAHITIRDDLTGAILFGLVHGDIDARARVIEGVTRVEFSWSGTDENDPVSGCCWLDVTGNQAKGRIFIHQGDDSFFTAVRAG